jgi:low temperature requirement protein LtrA
VAWSCASGILWIAGAFAAGSARVALWGAALTVDLVAPWVGFRTPWLGRSRTGDWDVEGAHFAERFQAFLIIALGESIVVTGATASARGLSMGSGFALASAFVITGALCWLYFDQVAEQAQRHIASSEDPGRLARDAYSYLHLPLIAGIVLLALGLKQVQASVGGDEGHSLRDALPSLPLVSMYAGVSLFLLAHVAFAYRVERVVKVQRVVVALALLALIPLGLAVPALAALALVTAVMVVLIAGESVRFSAARERIRHEDDEAGEDGGSSPVGSP